MPSHYRRDCPPPAPKVHVRGVAFLMSYMVRNYTYFKFKLEIECAPRFWGIEMGFSMQQSWGVESFGSGLGQKHQPIYSQWIIRYQWMGLSLFISLPLSLCVCVSLDCGSCQDMKQQDNPPQRPALCSVSLNSWKHKINNLSLCKLSTL